MVEKRGSDKQMAQRIERLLGQWAQGRVNLKQILGLTPEELYAVAIQGYNLFLEGRANDARVMFEGLVSLDPHNAYYHRALGMIYWQLKEPQKALRQIDFAIRVDPTEIASYLSRAEIYVANQHFDLARQDLAFAIDNARPHERSLVRKARAMLQMI